MKRRLLFSILSLFALISCKGDPETFGTDKDFSVVAAAENQWKGSVSYKATSASYNVIAMGGNGITVEEVSNVGNADFVYEIDQKKMIVTVKAPTDNETTATREVTIKIVYNNEIWKFLSFKQVANMLTLDLGEEQTDGVVAYTVDRYGATTFIGSIFNPSASATPIIEFVSSDDAGVDENTFIPVYKDKSLSFTAAEEMDYIGTKTAKYKVYLEGKEDTATEILVRQYGVPAPDGAISDNTAPGGYYFRMKYNGLDVAGEDLQKGMVNGELVSLDEMSWADIFYPNGGGPAQINTWAESQHSTDDPCPAGWRAMTHEDAWRLVGGTIDMRFGNDHPGVSPVNSYYSASIKSFYGSHVTGFDRNYEGTHYNVKWYVQGLESLVALFPRLKHADGKTINQYYILLNSWGVRSDAGYATRFAVLHNYAEMVIEPIAKTATVELNDGTQQYGIRCVRDTPAVE